MDYSLAALYGGAVAPQPVSTPGPDANAGAGSPARTAGRPGIVNNPTLLLVGLIGLALGLIHFSVGFGVGK